MGEHHDQDELEDDALVRTSDLEDAEREYLAGETVELEEFLDHLEE